MSQGTLELGQADLSDLPLPFGDNAFDRILCHNVIECVFNKIGLINDCFRVLKPGGLLLLSHHDFDTAVYNSEFVDLTRVLVNVFSDTKQAWQDTSDGQTGRKVSGLVTASHFGRPVKRGTLLIEEYQYTPEAYGFRFSRWASEISFGAGRCSKEETLAWTSELEAKSKEGSYYFSICLMAAIGEKPTLRAKQSIRSARK
jgi:SAM-dependent methyltransferase